ncbi:hypothetical protein [Bradyrhizobium sp. 144]|uniref:hypothetical protein n=1 Tax=Bradyrhizobium sp. 144 TaxID=2782620 RepID=UPI001FFB9F7E|nr:hypothetical protein [Bradyrhizobium sp. 144]MCK1693094.1 hypothetical protein [Bradyrhizobium sp. 144]
MSSRNELRSFIVVALCLTASSVLALGLLVTPAAAETYTKRECAVVEQYFRYCVEMADSIKDTVDGSCMDAGVGYKWIRWSRDNLDVITQRHHLGDTAFPELCQQVCHEKTTWQQALQKFCSRPAPAGYAEIVIQEAEAAMLQHYSRGKISAADALRLAAPVAKVLKQVRTKP